MAFFVRKINRSNWSGAGGIPVTDVFEQQADGIAICLKTSNNRLSVWEISSVADISQAILAISSAFTKLETFYIVLIESDFLDSLQIPIRNSPGRTPVEHLVNMHVDIVNLNYYRIGLIAEYIIKQINSSNYERIDVPKIKEIINRAIDDGHLDKTKLNPEFAKHF